MDLLWGDETLFKNEEVFDPEYVPDVLLFRDMQINALVSCLRPAVKGQMPAHVLCIGPPSTGKTTVVRYVSEEIVEHGVEVVHLQCPALGTAYNIFSRIYEIICGNLAPQKGVPIYKLLAEVAEELDDKVLIVVLDDINFVGGDVLNKVLSTLLKSTREEFGLKVGVILIAMTKNFIAKLDPYVGSIFHFYEIVFPAYNVKEIREILRWRVEHGFYEGVVSEEAFDRIVELASRISDIRYGLHLLRVAGLNAERRGSKRIELRDVEIESEDKMDFLLVKTIGALNSDEKETLKIIYMLDEDDVSTGDVYAILKSEVSMSYDRFYEIMNKLERLRFVDLVFGKKGRGRTRYVMRRYERDVILKALREV